MIRLDLDDEEARILRDVLDSQLSDLRYEISNTDSYDYRQALKQRKAVVEKSLAACALSTPAT